MEPYTARHRRLRAGHPRLRLVREPADLLPERPGSWTSSIAAVAAGHRRGRGQARRQHSFAVSRGRRFCRSSSPKGSRRARGSRHGSRSGAGAWWATSCSLPRASLHFDREERVEPVFTELIAQHTRADGCAGPQRLGTAAYWIRRPRPEDDSLLSVAPRWTMFSSRVGRGSRPSGRTYR